MKSGPRSWLPRQELLADLHQQSGGEDLKSTLDVAPAVAAAIVRRRTENGAYKSIDDLTQVPGITAGTIEARKDRLIF